MPTYNTTVESVYPEQRTALIKVDARDSIDAMRKALTMARKVEGWPDVIEEMNVTAIEIIPKQETQSALVMV